MEKELGEVEQLWLPPEFIFDDFFVEGEDRRSRKVDGVSSSRSSRFTGELGWGLASNPASPLMETESDDEEEEEEDYMAGLTQKMAHSFLLDEEHPRDVAGSPQSTLCSWPSSKKGSSDGASQVSSPPLSPTERQQQQQQQGKEDEAWDLFSKPAGQVLQLKLDDMQRRRNFQDHGFLGPPRSPSPPIAAAPPCKKKTAGTGYYASPLLNHQQLQAAQFYRLKQLQQMKQQLSIAWQTQSKSRSSGRGGGGCGDGRSGGHVGLCPSAWPPLQKQWQPPLPTGNGMRAVFLESSGTKKESAGTGVFLPRTPGSAAGEPQKKPNRLPCSTVLVPAKVVQALNLNLEGLVAQPCCSAGSSDISGSFVLDHEAPINRRKGPSPVDRRQPPAADGGDICLPQEWIY